MLKNVVETEGRQMTSQYGSHALRPGKARLHAHTHTPRSNTYCFSTATTIRERASMLRYVYIACLVLYFQYFSVRVLVLQLKEF
jgi:hypothetical protein